MVIVMAFDGVVGEGVVGVDELLPPLAAGTAAATDAQQRKNRGEKNPDVHESSWEEIPTSPARVSSAMIDCRVG